MRSLFKMSILKQVNGDVKLAEKLTPKYEIGCKRLLGMNDFVPMFVNKPNAHLITEGKGLKRTGPLSSGNWKYRGSALVKFQKKVGTNLYYVVDLTQ